MKQICDICKSTYDGGGYALPDNHHICDNCGRKYTLEQINKKLGIESLSEEATQTSMVDGGRVDVFTNNGSNHFNEDDWYKQLFELNDIN